MSFLLLMDSVSWQSSHPKPNININKHFHGISLFFLKKQGSLTPGFKSPQDFNISFLLCYPYLQTRAASVMTAPSFAELEYLESRQLHSFLLYLFAGHSQPFLPGKHTPDSRLWLLTFSLLLQSTLNRHCHELKSYSGRG